jgi:hypothetical protein
MLSALQHPMAWCCDAVKRAADPSTAMESEIMNDRQGRIVEHLAPVCRNADQADGEAGNAVPLPPIPLHLHRRPIMWEP